MIVPHVNIEEKVPFLVTPTRRAREAPCSLKIYFSEREKNSTHVEKKIIKNIIFRGEKISEKNI